ncbi:MAG: Dna2/Cas4 domain-containing protein [Chloroflexi bacterium]|nr:Dna2/Cas4 domain-containing protein [Chloroflexota bacterium]
MADRIIRASEIGEYVYCKRAWWLRAQGYQPANVRELAAGTTLHERHGRAVIASGCLRSLAYLLLLAALALLAVTLAGRFLTG